MPEKVRPFLGLKAMPPYQSSVLLDERSDVKAIAQSLPTLTASALPNADHGAAACVAPVQTSATTAAKSNPSRPVADFIANSFFLMQGQTNGTSRPGRPRPQLGEGQ